jgi:hypothetical protein
MTRMNRLASFLLLAALAMAPALACAPAQAQEPPREPPLEEIEKRRDKVLEKMQAVRAWKLAEVLELNEKNGPKLLSTLSDYDEKIFNAHMELRKSERSLKRAFRKQAPDAELAAGLDRVLAARKKVDALRYEQLEKAGATLDVRRRVKLYHFLPRFEKEMRRRLRGGPGPGGDGFQGPRGKGKGKAKGKGRHRGF